MEPTATPLPFERALAVAGRTYRYTALSSFPEAARLPVCLRILLENVVRRSASEEEARERARAVIEAGLAGVAGAEIEFMPARVLFQDFTGVPVFCDFAAMRDSAAARGEDPSRVNPLIPCTLVIDHSVTADVVSCPEAARENARIEAARNAERFAFLKWAAESFDNVSIVPPGVGICHQLNVERFCRVAWTSDAGSGAKCADKTGCAGTPTVYFDTLVGTDSHTPTANGLGVLGWGVGGIEAEAAALGQPISMTVPPVVGVRLTGQLAPGVSGMDVALTFAERLRAAGVVGSLVECFGPGVASLTVTQRTTIANMTPEYGATATFFPADEATLEQLALFGRSADEVELARAYLTAQGMLGASGTSDADTVYSRVIELDLAAVEPSLAGPSRPHDRVPISGVRHRFREALARSGRVPGETFSIDCAGAPREVSHGAIAIAAVTSCTTATDPAMMVAAGLTARRALDLGWTRTLLEGFVKVALLVGYLAAVSRMKEMKRLFGYHGAEHKTIACYEAGMELTTENIRTCSRFHPRCGTSFLLIVVLVSILVNAALPWSNLGLRAVYKLLLLPVVVGISYEIIKFCGRYDNPVTHAVSAPGLWLQHITTNEPDDSMIECAVAAIRPVLPENREEAAW